MKIEKNVKRCIFIVLAALFTSCTTVQSAWQSGGKNIEKEIKKTDKEGLIIFTASDTDERSKTLFKNVFTKDFFTKAGKKFALYNVDIVKNESLMSSEQLEKNYILLSDYNVSEVPHLILMTNEGDVYHSALLPEDIKTADLFLKYLNSLEEKAALAKNLKSEIQKKRGAEKTQAIERFFEKIYFVNSPKYKRLFEEGIESDPKNESGLIGKFILAKKYLVIDNLLANKKYEEAVNEFKDALETKMLSPEEEQNVWCNIAYISAHTDGGGNKNKVMEYLEKAIKAAPSSERVKDIKADIEFLKKP